MIEILKVVANDSDIIIMDAQQLHYLKKKKVFI